MYKFHCFQDHYTLNKVMCTEKLSEKIQNDQKWLFQIFLTIFPKKTGINLEQPKMAIPNFF